MRINDFAERNMKNCFFESIDLSQGGCNIEFYTDESKALRDKSKTFL